MPRDEQDGSVPFKNQKFEIFAQSRGFDRLTLAKSYEACGGPRNDANRAGYDMLKTKGMKPRVAYLADLRIAADLNRRLKDRETILLDVQDNAVNAAADGQYSASNMSYKMLGGELHGMFRDKIEIEQPGRALKDGSLKAMIHKVEETCRELGIEFDVDAFLKQRLGITADGSAGESAPGSASVEIPADQPLQAEPEAASVPRSGGDVLGTSDFIGKSNGKNLVRGSGDELPHDGAVPRVVEGSTVPEPDSGMGSRQDE
jgi:hypothetical protein